MTLISMHIAKCGGTTLELMMKKALGEQLFHHDAGNPCLKPTDYAVIHGHMEKYEYRGFPVFTVMRDPIDRMISMYYFIRSLPNVDMTNPVNVAIKLGTFMNFAETYLNNGIFKMLHGSLLGLTWLGVFEDFQRTVKQLEAILNLQLKPVKKQRVGKYNHDTVITKRERSWLEQLNSLDMEMYDKAVRLHKQQLIELGVK